MKIMLPLIVGVALAAPAFAADEPRGFLDVGYAPSSVLELSDAVLGSIESDGGAGFGVRARYAFVQGLYVTGEYQRNSYDGFEGVDLDTDVDALRAGAGYRLPELPLYAQAEFVREKLDFGAPINDGDSASGYGLAVGAEGNVLPALTLYAQAGYLDVGDFGDGFEVLAGGAYAFTRTLGLFADYRQFEQKEQGTEIKVADFRAGLRVFFGR